MIESSLSAQLDKSRRHTRVLSVVMDYVNGEPLAIISERYDLAGGTISGYARAAGVPARRGPLPKQKELEIAALYKSGTKIKDICDQTGVDRKTVWIVARKRGLKLRNKSGGVPKLTPKQVRMVRASKGNISQLARDMEVDRTILQRIRSGKSYKNVK